MKLNEIIDINKSKQLTTLVHILPKQGIQQQVLNGILSSQKTGEQSQD